MLTVHHLRNSQSERVVWLCEELGLDYDLKVYNRQEDQFAPPEYRALSPMGIAPVITDGDITMGESGAIMEYIDRKYGGSRHSPGPDHPDFADHVFWLHFSNATFMANVMMHVALLFAGVDVVPAFVKERTHNAWKMAEDRLGTADWFGGSRPTTADFMMGYTLTRGAVYSDNGMAETPHLDAYIKRIAKRPAYQRAMAKAEPGEPLPRS
ncbi:MAG: glutathione S-transferase [Caenibius sp.]